MAGKLEKLRALEGLPEGSFTFRGLQSMIAQCVRS